MAENQIAYKIVVETSKAVQQIKALEEEISRLKQVLQETPEGTEGFETLSAAVNGLENQLNDVIQTAQRTGDVIITASDEASSALNKVGQTADKTGDAIEDVGKKTKQISFEKAFQSFVKVGSAVTSSFAAAQAAIGLFGGDSTKVAEAAAKAQNALTLAIAAREIVEGLGAITTVKATIAQRAKNLADTASIGILKKLFAVIAANPYTALAVAIGLVVTALYTLISAETEQEKQAKKSAEAQKEFNDALKNTEISTAIAVEKYSNLIFLLNKGKITLEQFDASIEELTPNIDEFAILGSKAADAYDDFLKATIYLSEQTANLKDAEEAYAKVRKEGDKATQQQFANRIAELQAQRAVNLEIISRINKQIKDAQAAEEKRKENERKAAEDRKAALLEEIKLTSQLVIENQKRYKSQQKLGELNVQTATQNQVNNLKGLTEATDEYLTVTQKWANLTKNLTEQDLKAIADAESEITAAGVRVQNLGSILEMAFKDAGVKLKTTEFKRLLKEQFDIEAGVINDLDTQFKNFKDRAKFESDFIKQYADSRLKTSKNTGDALKAEGEAYRAEAKALFDTLVENEGSLNSYQASVVKTRSELARLTEESEKLKNSTELLSKFISDNAVDITKQYSIKVGDLETNRAAVLQLQKEFDTKNFDSQKSFQNQITDLEKQLLAQGLDIRNASYEVKLKLLKEYLEKEVKAVEEAEGKKQETEQKRLDKFVENIQAFQSVLNSLQQTTTLFYEAQFDTLEKRYKRLQDTIVGDSEEAAKKRIEAEKIYNAERDKLEKQQAKTSLRISLAQALANTAEAVTKVTAELGPIGLIAAGAVVAFNAAQVAVIGNQLANIDNYRRGGRIKMAGGGLVEGPAHEYGGVKFQGGGIELEGNEAVINRVSTINYMGLLDQINQAGGGKPIGNFDDSRIVEAIAKQRNTPIRAYVVESDITAKQTTARRLEELASF